MRKANFFIMMAIVCILIISFIGVKGQMIEELEIPIGVGYDITKVASYTMHRVPLLAYSFEEGKVTSNILMGTGFNLGETRVTRQLKSSRKYMLGLNRIFVFSEEAARDGLNDIMDILVNNPEVNDRAICVVCKGKAEDILKFKAKGYPSSAEYIYGMVRNLNQYNFMPMEYTVMDMVVRIDAEGRNVTLPYVELRDEGLETTGMALFKEDKMVGKADIKESKIINILRENKVKGILTIQKGSKEYINTLVESKRKIRCQKKDGGYKFTINLEVKGSIIANSLSKNLTSDIKKLNDFQEEMRESIQKMCEEQVNKIKCEYKTDVLNLGRVAAATYGRGTGTDWNKVICDSTIEVNVKFTIDTEGRGDY